MSPNYKMIPGSREKDTEGTFRDTPGVNYMTATNMGHATAPANFGHESGKKKKKIGTEDMSYEEKLAYYEQQRQNSKNKKQSGVKMGIGTGYTSLGGK